jgi:hypothetical protein
VLQTKTHFEQVPIEIVRRIVEEQIRQEKAVKPTQDSAQKSLELEVWDTPEHSVAKSRTFSEEVGKPS